jgi:hypothetical protein
MRKLSVIALLAASVLLLGGCDLFRKMAGRPTSAEIEAKRELIESEQAGHRGRLDSLEMMQAQISDSLEILDSIRAMKSSIVEARQLSESVRRSLPSRYYVIVGTFGKADNAARCASSAEQAGYAPTQIKYRNGFTAVGVCATDSLPEAFSKLREIRSGGFCADAWILDNSRR